LAVAVTREQVIEYLSALPPERLRELIAELEDIWGIEQSAGSPPVDDGEMFLLTNVGPVEWDVVLLEPGPQRIAIIRAVRESSPSLSLGEARALVDAAPVAVREGLDRYDAHVLLERLRALGAVAELR
jgi:large subunit ribosomal protein L7/L12